MAQSVKLPDKLLEAPRRYVSLNSRSVPNQIEYWSRIGTIAEENPDVPYNFLKQVLTSKQEADEASWQNTSSAEADASRPDPDIQEDREASQV